MRGVGLCIVMDGMRGGRIGLGDRIAGVCIRVFGEGWRDWWAFGEDLC